MGASVRAGGLRGYLALMRSLNCDPAPLLLRHGLQERQLSDEDAMLPLSAVVGLFEDSAGTTGCADFALRLAQVQDINILGPIAVAIQNCPTLERALECISNYLFIQSPGIQLRIEAAQAGDPGDARLRYEVEVTDGLSGRQIHEHGLAIAHRIFGMLSRQAYDLRGVSLSHEPVAGASALARYFAAPVAVARDYCALHLSRRTLNTPLPSANPVLLKMAGDFLDANYANPRHTVTARVRQLLSRQLGSVPVNKAAAARALAMHPRTLQRHLDAEGTCFNAVRDAVRRDAALRYLGSTSLPLTQVASLTGFSEQSALTRFCQQHFAQSPKALRAGRERRAGLR